MHSFVVHSDAFDVVEISGKDAQRFLQGQVTCNVETLTEGACVHGACCDNKGRVVACFLLVLHGGTYYLCMSAGVGNLLILALKKYIPFYQCTMQLAAGNHRLIGLAGDYAVRGLQCGSGAGGENFLRQPPGDPAGWICTLDGTGLRALWWTHHDIANISERVGGQPAVDSTAQWEALALLQGHFPFQSGDSGVFTPQELHLDLNGYISFNKGCYTGQEIVARLHYRGKLKRQLYLLQVAIPLAQTPGNPEIRSPAGEELGTALLARSIGGCHLVLARLPADFQGPFPGLECGGTQVVTGCHFEEKVIQLASLLSL